MRGGNEGAEGLYARRDGMEGRRGVLNNENEKCENDDGCFVPACERRQTVVRVEGPLTAEQRVDRERLQGLARLSCHPPPLRPNRSVKTLS